MLQYRFVRTCLRTYEKGLEMKIKCSNATVVLVVYVLVGLIITLLFGSKVFEYGQVMAGYQNNVNYIQTYYPQESQREALEEKEKEVRSHISSFANSNNTFSVWLSGQTGNWKHITIIADFAFIVWVAGFLIILCWSVKSERRIVERQLEHPVGVKDKRKE